MHKIIHIVDYPQGNPWIEHQMMYFLSHGINQGLISINSDGELLKNLRQRNFTEIYKCRFNVLGFLLVGNQIIKDSNHFKQILYAHGHKPSIMALVLKLIFGLDYVIAHHHPPRWIDMFQEKHKYRGRYHQFLRDKYYKHALAIQAFSIEVQEFLEKRGGLNERILAIPLGVDFDRFKGKLQNKSPNERPKGKLRILTVSRLAWEKRIELCLEFAHELSQLDFDFEYSIIGDGPLMKDLVKKRDELELQRKVRLLGWIDNIDDFYKSHDVLLHLSATESFGQVILEARLHGLSVLTSPCGIAFDMAKINDSGFHILSSIEPHFIAKEMVRISKIDMSKNYEQNTLDIYRKQEFFQVQERLRLAITEMFDAFI